MKWRIGLVVLFLSLLPHVSPKKYNKGEYKHRIIPKIFQTSHPNKKLASNMGLNLRPLNGSYINPLRPLESVHTTYYMGNGKIVGEKIRSKMSSEVNDVVQTTYPRNRRSNVRSKRMTVKQLRRSKRWYGEIERHKEDKPLIAHGTNEKTRYVELFVVADHSTFMKYGDFWTVVARIKQVIQIANEYMREVNFFLVLTGLEVWDQWDEVLIPPKNGLEIDLFKNHTQQLVDKHTFDVVLYLVGDTFSNLFGQSFSGRMCSDSYAYVLVADVSEYPIFAASTLAHALALTVNVTHDALHCRCFTEPLPCIMNEVHDNINARTKWSECSLQRFKSYITKGGGYCLMNRPTATLFGSTCGDGLIEKDEECDCGLPEYGPCAFSKCCDAVTCKLKDHAICSAGECCNTTSCQFLSESHICRQSKSDTCDIAETCSGVSASCPDDVYVTNGKNCVTAMKEAFCYKGKCENHESQCKKLYGEGATVADDRCYTVQNLEGQPGGSCDSRHYDNFYPPCQPENVWCGTLHCTHPRMTASQTPKYLGGLQTLWTNFNNRTAKHWNFGCKWVVYDVGLNQRDPGLVQDGVKCYSNSMCINSECVKIHLLNFPSCPKCFNGGKCTNLGVCDCGPYYLPPFCKEKSLLHNDALSKGVGNTRTKVNLAPSSRNFIVGSLVGMLLMVAMVIALTAITRKLIFNRNAKKQFQIMSNSGRKSGASVKKQSFSCNGNKGKNNKKLSPVSSPKHARKEKLQVPSLRVYDISSPFLQSSTNNHLTQLTVIDSTSTADSNSTMEDKNLPCALANKTLKKPSIGTPPEESIYANDIMATTLNEILNNNTLFIKNQMNELEENSTDQSVGNDEMPRLKYENIRDVKVQKEECEKVVDKEKDRKAADQQFNQDEDAVYANSMCLPQAPVMQTFQTTPAVRYDNVDDLISVRCPLYQPIIKPTNELSSFQKPSECLYSTPLGKKKYISEVKKKT